MKKIQYFIYGFSTNGTVKNLSGEVLLLIDHTLKMFQNYAYDSYELCLQQILYNLTKNNEGIFGTDESDIKSDATTSIEKQSNEKTWTFEEQSSSSNLFFEDKKEEALESESIGSNIAKNNQECVKFWETDEEFNSSEENSKIAFSLTSGTEMRSNLERKRYLNEAKGNIGTLLARNLMKIASVSIITEKFIGVEMFVYSPSESPESDGNSSNDLKDPDTGCGKGRTKLPSGPSKCHRGFKETRQSVDYSHPCVWYFLSQRLLSILSSRKTYMQQFCNSLKKNSEVINQFKSSIIGITQLMKDFGMANQSQFGDELNRIRNEIINKSGEMLEYSDCLIKDIEKKTAVYENCLQDINSFKYENVLHLLNKSKQIEKIQGLKKLDLCLKKICKEVDDDVLFFYERKKILFDFAFSFERLVKHLIKYLIIKGILMLPPVFILGDKTTTTHLL